MHYTGLLQTYEPFLPVNERTPLLTMQEGNAPLVRVLRKEGYFSKGRSVVCALTVRVLEDPDIAIKRVAGGSPHVVKDNQGPVMGAIVKLEGETL